LTELRLIAVGHKSLPRKIHEEMRNASIFLGYRRGKSSGRDGYSLEADEFELCKAEGVLVADDMESRRTFGDCIFIAPQEELLESKYLHPFWYNMTYREQNFTLKCKSNH
jgi:hypothetical protein